MTLREYFTFNCRECDYIENAKISEQIADDYAIDFAEWFWINKDKFYKGERDFYLEFNQLLEIFKKEKGL